MHDLNTTPAINSVGLYWPEVSEFEHSLLTGQTAKSHLTQLVFLAPHGYSKHKKKDMKDTLLLLEYLVQERRKTTQQ